MGKKEFYIDYGFYKEKVTGSVVTLYDRDVGIAYRDGYYYATDVETGLNLRAGDTTEKECIKETKDLMNFFDTFPKEKLQKQSEKLNQLPFAELNKIIIRADERKISGMLNYKYFNSIITETPEGIKIELEEAQLFTQEECDLIIDQIQELLAIK